MYSEKSIDKQQWHRHGEKNLWYNTITMNNGNKKIKWIFKNVFKNQSISIFKKLKDIPWMEKCLQIVYLMLVYCPDYINTSYNQTMNT